VAAWAERGALALGSTITVLVVGIWLYRYFKVQENREQFAAWASRTLDRPLLRPVAAVVRPLWRRTWTVRRFVADRLTPGELGLEVTTLHATMAVGWFFFLGNAIELRTETLLPGDQSAADLVDRLRADWLTSVMKVVTDLGSTKVLIPAILLTIVFLIVRRAYWDVAVLASGSLLTLLVVQVAKDQIDRPRPTGSLVATEDAAYPSGHSAHAVAWLAISVLIGRALPGLARPAGLVVAAIVVVAAVAASRVYLGAHYLSDVVGGVGLGTALYSACALIVVFIVYVRQNGRSSEQ
jgi:undecaprenyl-diphosphatase